MKHIYRFKAMTTPCEVILYAKDKAKADTVAKLILQEVKRLEKKYNFFDPNSYLSLINKREVEKLDSETLWLIKSAQHYHKKTNGIFDITLGALKQIYSSAENIEELERLKEDFFRYSGMKNIKISKNKIVFLNSFVKIDFGGMVKEYAVDRAVKIIDRKGIASALVNFGGDIYVMGKKPDKTAFKVGIKDPKDPKNFIKFVELQDQAITTSASYERGYLVGEKNFSHIVSKDESQKQPLSVSVVSKSCLESGVFSTALMIDPTIKTSLDVFVV